MDITTQIQEALANLFTAKLRSFLAVLGILVGTAAVVALLSGGRLATQHALQQFKHLGTNLLSVHINPAQKEDSNNPSADLTLRQALSLKHTVPTITHIAPYTDTYLPASYRGHKMRSGTLGVTETIANIIRIDMAEGRFISDLDNTGYFCVIGDDIAKKLRSFGLYQPLGKQIRLGDNYFTIVGIAKPWMDTPFMYADINHAILIPLKTSMVLSKYSKIRSIVFRLQEKSDINGTKTAITNAINRLVTHKRIFFVSAKQLIKSMSAQRRTFTWLLGFIGGISLLVGGIGVMNIMLVSVTERRREIGIRLAIGAHRSDIQWMFLFESVTLTLCGGVLGILLGTIASYVIALIAHWKFTLWLFPSLVGAIVSILVGVFFGFYPAYQAARLDPIESLRAE